MFVKAILLTTEFLRREYELGYSLSHSCIVTTLGFEENTPVGPQQTFYDASVFKGEYLMRYVHFRDSLPEDQRLTCEEIFAEQSAVLDSTLPTGSTGTLVQEFFYDIGTVLEEHDIIDRHICNPVSRVYRITALGDHRPKDIS